MTDTTYNLTERLRDEAKYQLVGEEGSWRVADLLEEAADRIDTLESYLEGAPDEHEK